MDEKKFGVVDRTEEFEKEDIEKNKVMSVLAYIWWLVIVTIVAAPNSKFARFHANQGLILAIALTVFSILAGILTGVLGWIPVVGWIVSAVFWLIDAAIFALMLYLIITTAQGKAKELPFIGKFKILK